MHFLKVWPPQPAASSRNRGYGRAQRNPGLHFPSPLWHGSSPRPDVRRRDLRILSGHAKTIFQTECDKARRTLQSASAGRCARRTPFTTRVGICMRLWLPGVLMGTSHAQLRDLSQPSRPSETKSCTSKRGKRWETCCSQRVSSRIPFFFFFFFFSFRTFLRLQHVSWSAAAYRSGNRLGPDDSAKLRTWSSSGPCSWLAQAGTNHVLPNAVAATACCTVTANWDHHLRDQGALAAVRRAGGARWALTRTRSRTRRNAPSCQRPPTSVPRTTSRCAPPMLSSGYATRLCRSAILSAAPSVAAAHGCGCPVRVSGETNVASQQRAPPSGVAP